MDLPSIEESACYRRLRHPRIGDSEPFTLPWEPVWERHKAGSTSADEVLTDYLRVYEAGLRELGYSHVFDREVRRLGRTGGFKYHLVFATTNPAGERIMRWCFDKVAGLPVQMSLFDGNTATLDF